jgi:3-oxoadipate enol-lactonase
MTAAAVVLHTVEDGPADAPVVVLGGSLGSTLAMWKPQLPALTDRYRVIRYDHRGHGGSPAPPGPYDLPDLAADVLALLDRLGLDRISYCGLSLGGMVGMRIAADAPDRVDRLVLCCTAARMDPAAWAERAAGVRAGGTAAIADTVVSRWVTPGYRQRHPDVVEEMAQMIRTTSDAAYEACCGAIARMDLRPVLPSITAPTLVVAGAQDPATPPQHAYDIAAAIPGARVEVVADAAHLANVERAEEVNRLLRDHHDPAARS